MATRPDYPTTEWAKAVCKIGQGAACCRYLTMSPNGWSCEKHSSLRRHIDDPLVRARMTAQGDNCGGLKSR